MLKRLEGYGKFVEISGFRGIKMKNPKASVEALSKEVPRSVEVQFFNADLVASWQHLYFAALNALTAFATKRNLSNSLAVETVLYASAQRQIKKAIDVIGLKPESENAAVLVIGGEASSVNAGLLSVSRHLGKEPDATVLELSQAKTEVIRRVFDVSTAELEATSLGRNANEALVDLIIERVTLLSTRL